MKEFRSLKLLDLVRGLIGRMGINYETMRKILQVKLTMDQRRVPTMFQANMTEDKQDDYQFLKSLGIYVLYGLILIPFLFMGDYFIQMSIFFGVTMFILMTTLVSDFSAVLLDVRDKTLLNTKPVNERTVNAAKIVHIIIYITQLTGAFLLIPSIVAIFSKGIFFMIVLFFVMTLLILLIVALTALIYIYILKFFSSEKLRDIINYVQIFMSIGIVVGYQIVIRVFEFTDFDVIYTFEWWHIFIPPVWFGGLFDLVLQNNQSGVAVPMSLLAVVVPLLAIALYYRLMPTFERNLQKLMEETGPNKKSRWDFTAFWAKLFCRSREEQLFFRFSSIMMKRERDFKLRVYPSLGLALVFPFIFHLNYISMESFASLRDSNMHLTIYFTAITIGPVVLMLRYSPNYKGSWMFLVSPLQQRSRIYSATLKAFLFQLFVPLYAVLCAVFVFIFSARIIPDLIVVFMAIVLLTLISYKLTNNDELPFSRPFESAKEAGSTVTLFLLMLITGAFALFHWLVSMLPYGVYGYMGVLSVITIVSWYVAFRPKKPLIEL
ncbi:hypothetical protein [Lentibacillus saliphilus]|uniref:hypothetical protein n=1 Tax=Lentibacillus saliphilus TaxID=2737028 RepID=UPI001C30F8C3|nr:hypothetical protein [Lentibacillus saliphilus]